MALPGNRLRSSTINSLSSSTSSQPPVPLVVGESVRLFAWISDSHSGGVKARINLDAWPGCANGDLLSVKPADREGDDKAFLFIVSEEKGTACRMGPGTMQISLDGSIQGTFGFQNRKEVLVTKVDKDEYTAEHVEIVFRDQYLGRSEMWRLGMSLEETCVHSEQKVMFVACIEAQIKGIFVKGRKVPSAFVTPLTKTIYRSLSARHTLLIQISKELWEFAEDGERYYEKLCSSFLPALFSRWRNVNAHHLLSVVLVSRVYYDDDELKYCTPPIMKTKAGHSYKDLYKVIIDLEIMEEWNTALLSLKQSLWGFQREILLTQTPSSLPDADGIEARLIGRISNAHEGNVLEAINLALNPFERYHIDRDMGRTGLCISVITPGTGRFEVDKELLRLTNERMTYNGFAVDLVCLNHRPLHAVPLFSYVSHVPEPDRELSLRELNPLYYETPKDQPTLPTRQLVQYHMIPSWVYCSYWERSWDMPFRSDRFIPRCRMYEIQMLGLLEQDISSTISIPFLDEESAMFGSKVSPQAKAKARREFARNVFARRPPELDISPFGAPFSSGSSASALSRASLRSREIGPPVRGTSFRLTQPDEPRRSGLSQRLDMTPAEVEKPARRATLSAAPRGMMKTPAVPANEDPPRGRTTTRKIPSLPPPPLPPPSPPPPLLPSEPAATDKEDVAKPGTSPSGKSVKSFLSVNSSDKSATACKPRGVSGVFAPAYALLSSFRGQPALPHLSSFNAVSTPTPKTEERSHPIEGLSARTLDKNINNSVQPDKHVHSSHTSLDNRSRPAPKVDIKKSDIPVEPPISSVPVPISIKAMQSSTVRPHRLDAEPYTDMPLINPARSSYPRNSLYGDSVLAQKLSTTDDSTPHARYTQLASGLTVLNPSNPKLDQIANTTSDARRWKHTFPHPTFEHQMKWKSLCMPACLPLTIDIFPARHELENDFKTYSYDVVIIPDMESQFIRPPKWKKEGYTPEAYRAEQVIRAMASFRLAQGFQFVVAPRHAAKVIPVVNRLSGSYVRSIADVSSSVHSDPTVELRPGGASEVLRNVGEAPIYLTMGNQIHKFSYDKEEQQIQVKRFVRGRQRDDVQRYRCLIWPKHGNGYVLGEALFHYPLENVGWNRMDMLLAGYETQLADTMRYWRARFVVIPSEQPPSSQYAPGPHGERLSDEEVRIQGMNRLAEHFGRLRWLRADEKPENAPPVRLLITFLDPLACLLDEGLMDQLAEVHSPKARDRKRKSEKALEGASLTSIARAMRDPEGGLPIEDHKWHRAVHKDSFSGSEFVSFLLREYHDVSTREEAEEWGVKLFEQGLFEHCRKLHGFLDGHYFYRLIGEYAASSQPRRNNAWFKSARHAHSRDTRPETNAPAQKRTLVLTQSITLDLDPLRHSDQAEMVVIHYDVIHNPANAFHFELNWIGTTARVIDDMVQSWSKDVETSGLTMIEGYVEQIADISKHSPFQSCISVPLVVPPPDVSDLGRRIPLGAHPSLYFEAALLRELGYILDIEGGTRYPEQVNVKYSYRRSLFTYPQYVHRTGLAFVQVLGGTQGFKWLANGLAIAGGATRRLKQKQWDGAYAFAEDGSPQPAKQAEAIRREFQEFCSDPVKLQAFYDQVVSDLPPIREEYEETAVVPV